MSNAKSEEIIATLDRLVSLARATCNISPEIGIVVWQRDIPTISKATDELVAAFENDNVSLNDVEKPLAVLCSQGGDLEGPIISAGEYAIIEMLNGISDYAKQLRELLEAAPSDSV